MNLVYFRRMEEVSVHEAKTHLSRLLRRVALGEEIVICRGKERVARLVPANRHGERALGTDRGLLRVSESFDAPLPDDVLDDFEK